ncbi:hypothetical protein EVAR_61550_1 [Eumeta japonica]|uniref:Uncharacterized protein n=1 Tax=Eumeta variegata TaxID=151549 RepID=A0A4C1ZAY3_EUMVA|nr:hypothetical protein EVAR_61550_1 [Eumeta japonica]
MIKNSTTRRSWPGAPEHLRRNVGDIQVFLRATQDANLERENKDILHRNNNDTEFIAKDTLNEKIKA